MLTDLQFLLIAVLSLIDTVVTYEWVRFVRAQKNYKNYPLKKLEANPIVRLCWNNFGMVKGSIASGILLFVIQASLASIDRIALGVILTILVLAIVNHINNFNKFKERLKNEKKNNTKRKHRKNAKKGTA